MSILIEIFTHKKTEIAARMARVPEAVLLDQLSGIGVPPDFGKALCNNTLPAPRLIAEVKYKSPSKGILSLNFDPLSLAKSYIENGAQAISVLTDEKYFGGSMDYLQLIHQQYPEVPLLCKDFIFSRYQLLEANLNGASAALLIAAMLSQDELEKLIAYALELHITPFVEVHSENEFQRALAAGGKVIGINNRNLNDFTVSLETTLQLVKNRPENIVLVSESGINSLEDVQLLADAGIDAMLVGESIVTAEDAGMKVRELSRNTRKKALL